MDTEHYLRVKSGVRCVVVGDVHGHVDQLKSQLANINFNWEKDLLIGVGDWIDGGNQSIEALGLLQLPNVYSCIGNHEVDILCNGKGAGRFHESNNRGWYINLDTPSQEAIKVVLERLPLALYIESYDKKYCLTHASPTNVASEPSDIIWGVKDGSRMIPDESYDLSIHGHRPLVEPIQVYNHLWIDTYGKSRKFTFVELGESGWKIL